MPLLTLKLIADQPGEPDVLTRRRLIARLTEVVSEELGKNPSATSVIIETVTADDWGVGGISVAEKRAST